VFIRQFHSRLLERHDCAGSRNHSLYPFISLERGRGRRRFSTRLPRLKDSVEPNVGSVGTLLSLGTHRLSISTIHVFQRRCCHPQDYRIHLHPLGPREGASVLTKSTPILKASNSSLRWRDRTVLSLFHFTGERLTLYSHYPLGPV
jgi:hypothetical protein